MSLHHHRPFFFLLFLFFGCFSATVAAQCPPASASGIHVVQKGENLFRIAQLYGVSMNQLATWNNRYKDAPLFECDELIVSLVQPKSATVTPVAYGNKTFNYGNDNNYNGTPTRQYGKWHTVRSGETAAGLAALYGYTEERFREFNNIPYGQALNLGSVVRSSECSCEDNAAMEASPTLASRGVANPFPAPTMASGGVVNPTMGVNMAGRSFMTSEESAMIDEINLLRSDPNAYAGTVYYYSISAPRGTYSELEVNELRARLRRTPPLSILQANSCLYQVARRQGEYLRTVPNLTHNGPAGKDPATRSRESCPQVQLGTTRRPDGWIVGNENLSAGHRTARQAIIDLLIDKYDPQNGHREALLAPEWRYVATYNAGNFNGMINNYVQLFGR